MRHIGFAGIIEIDLNGAGAQHHVEAHAANARHVAQHDFITPLWHNRQLFPGFIRPKAKAQKGLSGLFANRFNLFQMPPRFGACLMQVFKRRTGQFKLPRRLQTDVSVRALHCDNVSRTVAGGFCDGFPAKFLRRHQQVADTAGFIIRRRVMIAGAIDEFLVLCTNAPALRGLFAFGHDRNQLFAVFNHRLVAIRNCFCAHRCGV